MNKYIHWEDGKQLTINTDRIKIANHIGTWYVIDMLANIGFNAFDVSFNHLFLLEHEDYGDEVANIIVDENCNIILEDVWNGFEDYADYLENLLI